MSTNDIAAGYNITPTDTPWTLGGGSASSQYYRQHFYSLEKDRYTWDDLWTKVAEVMASRKTRFKITQEMRNRTVRNDGILNNAAVIARRSLTAGIHANICSPSTDWLHMTTTDPVVADLPKVRAYRWDVDRIMRELMDRSGVYDVLEENIDDVVTFGTGVIHAEYDPVNVIRTYRYPIGQYVMSEGPDGEIDTVYRLFSMTAEQLVRRFGLDKVSPTVQSLYKSVAGRNEWRRVLHCIEPNLEHDPEAIGWKGKKYRTTWIEFDTVNHGPFLMQAGYDEFPCLIGRWATNGEDVYGSTCPGIEARPDAAELQALQKDLSATVAKIVRPPMNVPASMMNSRVTLLPGDINYIPDSVMGMKAEPALVIRGDALPGIQKVIEDTIRRINDTFFSRLWFMLDEQQQQEAAVSRTATEINAREAEKSTLIGPFAERYTRDVLKKLAERMYLYGLRSGRIPPYPEEMVGQKFKFVFQSSFTQGRKATTALGLQRLVGLATAITQAKGGNPDSIQKLDGDSVLTIYTEGLGLPPNALKTDEAVQQLRDAAQKQANAQMQTEQGMQQAQAAKDLAKADTSKDNALTRMLQGQGVQGVGQQAGPVPGGGE